MQWILSIHRAGGPTDTLLDRIPTGQAEIRCSDQEIEEGKPESDFPAAAGQIRRRRMVDGMVFATVVGYQRSVCGEFSTFFVPSVFSNVLIKNLFVLRTSEAWLNY